jgi:L-seryl-tRNA(Ser) seleniumtransferase
VDAIRNVLAVIRENYQEGTSLPNQSEIINHVTEVLDKWTKPTLLPVINATGVILHTNLGRAPLSVDTLEVVREIGGGYSTLEYDLDAGKRGSRLLHAENLLCRLTNAEAAMVVNNNAAAVLLVLITLAKRRKVIIARSQLVEIGGGFRIPDVMKQSGAKLLEVGTTNRVHLEDYRSALEEKPALIMRAHRSNFLITGFTSEPTLEEISSVARDAQIPLVDDLGSGSLLDTAKYSLAHEPMIQESLVGGADLVCFSGDKLLGGPQAGVIVGRDDLMRRLKRHPLARAIRADKLCLSAISATLLHYLRGEAEQCIPVWMMISAALPDLKCRVKRWQTELGKGEIIAGESTIGGGSLPGEVLPTSLLAITPNSPKYFMEKLRNLDTPVIARLENNQILFDPRTVLPGQDEKFLVGLKSILG